MRRKQGFSLISLLILLLAALVLLAMLYPSIRNSFNGAKAAADAVTMHRVANTLNSILALNPEKLTSVIHSSLSPESVYLPGAELQVLLAGKTIHVYFVRDGQYYSLDYITQVSETGRSDLPTDKPALKGTWYTGASGGTPER